MTTYAALHNYDIKYDEFAQKFFICSKLDNRPQIGGFDKAAEAIDFAEKRVIAQGRTL